ncbi:Putative hem oxygenase HugZ-like superfamily [Septoria linicola]|uniref:Hem oxygenase HugZ-like superfamily n=1 Tax=Septoria linicola TaxID=215465 RepID=A0A9Q9AFF3_9PEZI|nr:Putative hem oxygenase HugZ-like superfamily [Septoria linicola]
MAGTKDEDAAKNRIVSHMNNDHHDSIVRYLQHYGGTPSWKAWDGKITDVSLNELTLSCHENIVKIPFQPPMASYREARERVVDLDKTCRKALGHSDVTVKHFLAPSGLYTIPFLVIIATMVGYSQRSWFAQGATVERVLGSSFARFSWTIQPYLALGLLIIHGGECLFFAHTKLPRHSVNIRSSIYWLWTMSTFVEGQFAYKRFDDYVRGQREKQKH